nr:MAG TPA: hypothetical protein [Bacteriophage sp.]
MSFFISSAGRRIVFYSRSICSPRFLFVSWQPKTEIC